MRRRMMSLVDLHSGEMILCTSRHCFAEAKWWLTVRVDGLDEDHARCEEHSR